MRISVHVPAADGLAAALGTLGPQIVMDELEAATGSALEYLNRETRENTPTDLGTLRNAFIVEVVAFGPQDMVLGELRNPLPYALAVEQGAKPHFPPLAPLEAWVSRHLDYFPGAEVEDIEGIALGIQRKIGRRGSRIAAGMAHAALRDGRDTVQGEYAEAAQRIVARLGQAGQAAAAGGPA